MRVLTGVRLRAKGLYRPGHEQNESHPRHHWHLGAFKDLGLCKQRQSFHSTDGSCNRGTTGNWVAFKDLGLSKAKVIRGTTGVWGPLKTWVCAAKSKTSTAPLAHHNFIRHSALPSASLGGSVAELLNESKGPSVFSDDELHTCHNNAGGGHLLRLTRLLLPI